jgi:hypothetical protein
MMVLFLKNLLFTIIVPGTVAVYIPPHMPRHRSPAAGFAGVLTSGFCIFLLFFFSFAVCWPTHWPITRGA